MNGGTLANQVRTFVDEVIIPAEEQFSAERKNYSPSVLVLRGLQEEARDRDLWNLFTSLHPSKVRDDALSLSLVAEEVGRSPILAQLALNAMNPDALAIELLTSLGTADQQARWLPGLLDGSTRSAYCMSEPGLPGSDPSSIRTVGKKGGDGYLVSGSKGWCTGASDDACELLIVVALTEPHATRGKQHSLLLVERSDPGVSVSVEHSLFGDSSAYRGGHPDLTFDGCAAELLGEAGAGLTAAQRVLGPARMMHSMRLVGSAERALELAVERLKARQVHGASLSQSELWVDRIGGARIEIESMRALVRRLSRAADQRWAESVLKAAIPHGAVRIIDLAMQAFGADGFSNVTILPDLFAHARSLQVSDGPDEVHRRVVGRAEFRRDTKP